VRRSIVLLLSAISVGAVVLCRAEPFEDFGRLGWYGSCLAFAPFSDCMNPYLTDLDSVPDSLVNSIVRVRGDLVFEEEYCGQYPYPFFPLLENAQVLGPAGPIDLGCGILIGEPEEAHQGCLNWSSPIHGRFLVSYRGHAPGDTVGVIGIPDPCCVTVCMDGASCLEDWWYYPCVQPPPASEPFTWGALKHRFKE